MLVDAHLFHDPFSLHMVIGDNGSPERNKPFRVGLLIWWDDNLTEWSIEAWAFRRKQHFVLIRENGKPTERTSLRWKKGRSDEVDELAISKVSAGHFANETAINISPALACVRIEKILELVTVGETSDRLPIIL